MTQILHDVLNKYTYRRVGRYTFRFLYVYKNIIYLQTRACGADIRELIRLDVLKFLATIKIGNYIYIYVTIIVYYYY